MKKIVLMLFFSAVLSVWVRILLGVSLTKLVCLCGVSHSMSGCESSVWLDIIGDSFVWFGMIASLGYLFATGKAGPHPIGRTIVEFFKMMR